MNEEQIKQNAEAYADEHAVRIDGGGWEEKYDCKEQENAYISGAHSRDEEIEELQKHIERLSKREQMLFDREVELIAENEQLRNPWISVDERLPKEDKDNEGYSVKVIGLFEDGHISDCFCSIEERIWFTDIFVCEEPIAWMPIPELKK